MERYGWWDEPGGPRGGGYGRGTEGDRTPTPRERQWRGEGRDEWRERDDWRARDRGEDWRARVREDEWRARDRGEWRPEIDPPWVERGPEARRRNPDTRGLVEWEDRGPLEWLGDRFRETTGRGRGPKGYQRSDERIRDDVCERIARSGIDADEVEVSVKEREVTLAGTVRSRPDKWRLEELADDVFGVEDVHNTLQVRRTTERERSADPRH